MGIRTLPALLAALFLFVGLPGVGLAVRHPLPASTVAATAAERFAIVPAESRVEYHVGETFLNEGNRFNIAVGITNAILPQTYAERREVTLEITGNLKIREVAKPTTFTTTLKLERTTLAGTATARILITDFGFDPPVIFAILRAENEVKLEFHFTARRAP